MKGKKGKEGQGGGSAKSKAEGAHLVSQLAMMLGNLISLAHRCILPLLQSNIPQGGRCGPLLRSEGALPYLKISIHFGALACFLTRSIH